jgi:hypothetical protein
VPYLIPQRPVYFFPPTHSRYPPFDNNHYDVSHSIKDRLAIKFVTQRTAHDWFEIEEIELLPTDPLPFAEKVTSGIISSWFPSLSATSTPLFDVQMSFSLAALILFSTQFFNTLLFDLIIVLTFLVCYFQITTIFHTLSIQRMRLW